MRPGVLESRYNFEMLPRNLRPMRLSRRPEPFDSGDYLFEAKIDGFRALAYIENGEVSCPAMGTPSHPSGISRRTLRQGFRAVDAK
jgi:hypothetical protein